MLVTREFTGTEENEVIDEALDLLKLTRDQVQIEIKNEKSGFLKLGKKQIQVAVSFEEELMLGNRALLFIRDLLEKMNIEAKIYLIEESDEKIAIEIESPDSALIIGKNGKNLEAIQTLVNVIMNKNTRVWSKIIVDIGNYRHRKERRLQQLAYRTANQVKRNQKSQLLEPMNPFERRIIHLALKEEDNIETMSEGEGMIKRIRILFTGDEQQEQ
jgi:spoIIIJ-associated protein